jgi:hypothetical protein
MKFELTQELVKKLFDYDPLTGVLIWRKITSRAATIGQQAGSDNNHGYLRVGLYGKEYLVHIIIWVYMAGKIPEKEIGHVDGNKLNNTWDNLREGRGITRYSSPSLKSICTRARLKPLLVILHLFF